MILEAIKTKGLTKKYKDTLAVDRLDLSVKKGELFALLGVNGAGKTTTVKMLSGLTLPTSGTAFIGGMDIVKESEKAKGIIGVSPQETAVAQNLTVKENLELMCGIYGYGRDKTAETVKALGQRFGLDTVFSKKAGSLSGGWGRRLSIAMALTGDPEVLFLDEPTLGLDVIARSELWDVIKEMKGKVTIILTTHYMEEAALADRVVVLDSGEIVADGDCRSVFSKRKTLIGAGLELPQPAELIYELRQKGYDLPETVLSAD